MIIETILFVIALSILFSFIENKSNFPSIIMIPLIVGTITKYSLGDWDKDYSWTVSDIYYWICLIGFSALTVFIFNKTKMETKWN
jgi:hypothetical protein